MSRVTTHHLETRLTPIGDLRPHPLNPRNGDSDAIAESLHVNGQYRPIVTARDGTIIAGNHTYAAAMQLGWDTIATVALDLDPDSAEAKRIMLADNRTADLGQYDDALLLNLLQDQPIEGTGYTADDISDLEALLAYQSVSVIGGSQIDAVGSEPNAKATGQSREVSQEDRVAHYAALDTRVLILPYPVGMFAEVTDLLARVRAKAGVDTNAEAVQLAILTYLGEA